MTDTVEKMARAIYESEFVDPFPSGIESRLQSQKAEAALSALTPGSRWTVDGVEMVAVPVGLMERYENAVNDWIRTYASEHCRPEYVEESVQRIMENGGTLSYLAQLQADYRAMTSPEALKGGA